VADVVATAYAATGVGIGIPEFDVARLWECIYVQRIKKIK
jgi:hypothetical protein